MPYEDSFCPEATRKAIKDAGKRNYQPMRFYFTGLAKNAFSPPLKEMTLDVKKIEIKKGKFIIRYQNDTFNDIEIRIPAPLLAKIEIKKS